MGKLDFGLNGNVVLSGQQVAAGEHSKHSFHFDLDQVYEGPLLRSMQSFLAVSVKQQTHLQQGCKCSKLYTPADSVHKWI